ncbi:MAG TPA: alpha/beta fold hydrolase [Beijerinckiaceae bacterium]|jgi:pimeloyl-ACP methyl ester carboxylesterase
MPVSNVVPLTPPGEAFLARRMLAQDAEGPALEMIEALPKSGAVRPPILFVHGAFGGAWTWAEILMPYLARRGRASTAFSLRGHGASKGRESLRETRLDDYLADLRRVLRNFDEPPVIVAHSLGGLFEQRLLGRVSMRGLVLMASLPPEGLLFVGPRLALTDPMIWLEALAGSAAGKRQPIVAANHRILFSEGLPPETAARYAGRMTPEAPAALADAHVPAPIASAAFVGVPTLVLGGTDDRLVWRPSTLRTALYHGAGHRTFEGLGHYLHLDIGAEGVARTIVDWLDEKAL